jgi:hypothetical protein
MWHGGSYLIRMLTRSATIGLLFDAMAFIAVYVTSAHYNADYLPHHNQEVLALTLMEFSTPEWP